MIALSHSQEIILTLLQGWKILAVAAPLVIGLFFWVRVFDLNGPASHWPHPRRDKTMKFYPASLLIIGVSIVIAVEIFHWLTR